VSEFVQHVFEAVTIGSVLVAALLGMMIGAFYGYTLAPDAPPRYPFALWVVGLAFIAAFGVWAVLSAAPFQPPYQVGRGILWTVTCAAIPIGRFTRHRLQPHHREQPNYLETDIQREDRVVGDTRRSEQLKNDTAPRVRP
jgi:hypothetical protein